MSSDPGIVSVDQNGLLTAKGNGEADVTVSTQNGKTAVCHVTVKVRAIEKIELKAIMPLEGSHPLRAMLEKTALSCPVRQALRPDLETPIEWEWK